MIDMGSVFCVLSSIKDPVFLKIGGTKERGDEP